MAAARGQPRDVGAKTEEAVERELGADRSLSTRERGRVERRRRAGRRELVRRRADAWHAAADAPIETERAGDGDRGAGVAHVSPTCCRAAAGCGSRAKRPPVAVAALPEPAAAADGGARRAAKRRGISAATSSGAEAGDGGEMRSTTRSSRSRGTATLKKLCRAQGAAGGGGDARRAAQGARPRGPQAADRPLREGEGEKGARRRRRRWQRRPSPVRWTVAATSPLAATSGAPAPSDNSTRQTRT